MRTLPSLSWLAVLATLSCSSSSDAPASAPSTADSGLGADAFVMKSEAFTIAPGSEKYLCYTTHVASDLAFHSFSIGNYKTVHHVFFSQTLAPEQEGPHECPVLFKVTWLPLFTTGKGGTRLDLPEGSGFKLKQGAQIVLQLHLLNTSTEPVTETVQVNAKTMPVEQVKYSAALYPFGTTVFQLPPNSPSSVTHDCTIDKDMEAFVMFPHMHRLGKEMAFQVGKDAASLKDVWRGPYDFDAQQLIPQTIPLHVGDYARVICNFDNTTSRTITYGETTSSEMCFFSLFIKDGQQLNGNCVDISAIGKSPVADAGHD